MTGLLLLLDAIILGVLAHQTITRRIERRSR